jgi:hypothetical protein
MRPGASSDRLPRLRPLLNVLSPGIAKSTHENAVKCININSHGGNINTAILAVVDLKPGKNDSWIGQELWVVEIESRWIVTSSFSSSALRIRIGWL